MSSWKAYCSRLSATSSRVVGLIVKAFSGGPARGHFVIPSDIIGIALRQVNRASGSSSAASGKDRELPRFTTVSGVDFAHVHAHRDPHPQTRIPRRRHRLDATI